MRRRVKRESKGEGRGRKEKKNKRREPQDNIKLSERLPKFDKKYKSADSRNSLSPLLSINTKKSERHNN